MDSRFRGNDGGHMDSRFRGNDGGHMDSRFRGNDGGQMDSRFCGNDVSIDANAGVLTPLHRLCDRLKTRRVAYGFEIAVVLDPLLVSEPPVHGRLQTGQRLVRHADQRVGTCDVV